ncbi:SAM-dependent methyltransferase [Anaerobacillus arseniciselenatis]|uniref:SAM-dependent methyltransferase n=1 Tax=Anaerobacillus arseniciselenatis TaxID=85682 RepID=A0A1S2LRN0_9BACI|nr:class I SAM-dependent methyltransferase [Anaerobacillus arseniciselenatis]OIJ15171.1 SAM-dependent methyltransferase [Anaerobacillus arseniciselenatis]
MMKLVRRFKDIGINGMTARWYDKNSREHRIDEMRQYAEEVVKHITDRSVVLEVAPGPGYLSIELAKLGNYEIIGMDISKDFVEIAQKNAATAGVEVDFFQGNVSEMPIDDNTVDFIVCSAAFKNFSNPDTALSEMYRVLKPGGTALIIDMNGSASKNNVKNLTKEMGVKGVEALFMNVTFRFLKKGAYTPMEMNDLISKTEFKDFNVKENGVSLYTYLIKKVNDA